LRAGCRLEASYSWRQYINYLHRQLYVLDTYCNIHNRALNHTMMWIHAWASLSFATASLLGMSASGSIKREDAAVYCGEYCDICLQKLRGAAVGSDVQLKKIPY
jgi:hypothetical protein